MRFRFYRPHKLLIHLMFELERMTAKADFTDNSQIQPILTKLASFAEVIKWHGQYEDKSIHQLLRDKGSQVHEQIEAEHQHHDQQLLDLQHQLEAILKASGQSKIAQGYEFYMAYRLFLIESLQHLHDEETVIMSELQRLYTDEALKRVDQHSFEQMTPEQMHQMMQGLSPHMDVNDTAAYLDCIKETDIQKHQALLELIN